MPNPTLEQQLMAEFFDGLGCCGGDYCEAEIKRGYNHNKELKTWLTTAFARIREAERERILEITNKMKRKNPDDIDGAYNQSLIDVRKAIEEKK